LNILRYLTFIVSLELNNPFLKSEKHSKSIAVFKKTFLVIFIWFIFSEPSQSFRRGGGGPRQTSDGWRRRDDEDENNDQNEDSSTPANSSTSWTSRGGQTRRGGIGAGGGPLENRTKSNEKWTNNDDRPGRCQIIFVFNIRFFFLGKKVHRIVMNLINHVDGERMHLYPIAISIHVVHQEDEIVRFFFFGHNQLSN
jgi:hypothetical protein